MFSTPKTFHIIGGGISGLSAAKFIRQKHKNARIIIYEAAAHLGGRCFSFYDHKLQRNIDNATHAVLGANSEVKKLLTNEKFYKKVFFRKDKQIHSRFWQEVPFILLSVFNTQPKQIAKSLLMSLACKLFPFLPAQRKIYFSQGNLTDKLIAPLSGFADEVKTGWKLQSFTSVADKINKLKFNHGEIELSKDDIVISALDAHQYQQIFNGLQFEFNQITDIYFRTSVPLTLPNNIPFLGTPDNLADWIFINQDIVAVTISNSQDIKLSDEELARFVWQEVRSVNGLTPAFLPPYRVLKHKRATIRQDEKNQILRPKSARTQYQNLFLCGDWTMKDYPCCLEGAIQSGKRVSHYV